MPDEPKERPKQRDKEPGDVNYDPASPVQPKKTEGDDGWNPDAD